MLFRVRARRSVCSPRLGRVVLRRLLVFALLASVCAGGGCRKPWGKQSVRPRSLRDVPAERLAYRFEADANAPPATGQDPNSKLQSVQNDFDARRKDDALVRTVLSPDRQRALALYETGDAQPGEFRIDLYGAGGNFVRNVTPPELSGAFAPTVAWSPDGNSIAFIGRKSVTPQHNAAHADDAHTTTRSDTNKHAVASPLILIRDSSELMMIGSRARCQRRRRAGASHLPDLRDNFS